ncbi:hypothetical protein PFISCL1PPCAC_20522 [Pristionchus fissidentatus]|uniref:ELMO domain-containing protein n=1 Tax=Pristionchus fissidentatus TaxID=1538716 RepID=A0AAV5WBZ0_9BILA|nr:hypothetical protein PFISCL1PPCAC_20522 [Pristionchus fissidentatus]
MNTPAKHLKAVDTSQPAHVVKGGIVVDPRLFQWLPPSHKQGLSAPPLLMQVDLSKETLSKLISRAAVAYAVEEAFPSASGSTSPTDLAHNFGFLDTNDVFITALSRLHNGFTLRFTFSPERLVNQLWSERLDRPPNTPIEHSAAGAAAAANSTAVQFDSTLSKLVPYCSQRAVLHALDECAITEELLQLYDKADLERPTTELLMNITCGLIAAGLDWERLPEKVFEIVEGLMKTPSSGGDPNSNVSLIHSIRLLTLALESENAPMRARSLELVCLPALCPLVSRQANAEKLTKELLSLFRSVFYASESDRRLALIEFFNEPVFKNVLMAASVHVDREATVTSASNLHHAVTSPFKSCLLDLLQIRLTEYTAAAIEECCSTDVIKKMLELREVEDDDDLRAEWVATLRETPRSALTARFLLYMHRHNGDLLDNWRKENKLRSLCGAPLSTCWQLLPLAMNVTDVIVGILAIDGGENREWLWLGLTVLLEETQQTSSGALVGLPIERLFVECMQRGHALWTEMGTKRGEEQQVAFALTEMLWSVVRHRGVKTVAELAEALRSISYDKLREDWDEELKKRTDAEEIGGIVGDLRRKLEPLALSYVTTNRINSIKMGFQFKKIFKGKQVKDSAGELWKLEGNGNFLTIRDIDAPTGEGGSQRIEVKEIVGAVIERPKGNALPRLRLSVTTGPDLVVCTEEEVVLRSWVDGLNSLNEATHGQLSKESKALVQRLLTMEVRVRLLSLPDSIRLSDLSSLPFSPIEVDSASPPLPDSFKWCTDALKKVHV